MDVSPSLQRLHAFTEMVWCNSYSPKSLHERWHKEVCLVLQRKTTKPKPNDQNEKWYRISHLHYQLCTCTKMGLQFKVIMCVIFLSCFHLSFCITTSKTNNKNTQISCTAETNITLQSKRYRCTPVPLIPCTKRKHSDESFGNLLLWCTECYQI